MEITRCGSPIGLGKPRDLQLCMGALAIQKKTLQSSAPLLILLLLLQANARWTQQVRSCDESKVIEIETFSELHCFYNLPGLLRLESSSGFWQSDYQDLTAFVITILVQHLSIIVLQIRSALLSFCAIITIDACQVVDCIILQARRGFRQEAVVSDMLARFLPITERPLRQSPMQIHHSTAAIKESSPLFLLSFSQPPGTCYDVFCPDRLGLVPIARYHYG